MEGEGPKSGEMDTQMGAEVEDYDYDSFYPAPYPPGVRFTPSDEELIVHYLTNKVRKKKLPCSIIHDADLYKSHPQQLLATIAPSCEGVWYLFTPRDRKYANGDRPNRSTQDGYWKATGADQNILSREGEKIGFKKSLVYHVGKQPNGEKTGWMMHEYRIKESHQKINEATRSMLLDDWVLCKLYHKAAAETSETEDVMVENVSPEQTHPQSLGAFPKQPLDVPFALPDRRDLPFGLGSVDYEDPSMYANFYYSGRYSS